MTYQVAGFDKLKNTCGLAELGKGAATQALKWMWMKTKFLSIFDLGQLEYPNLEPFSLH